MLIRCPACQFEREINSAKIPASATLATCPKCATSFRFRDPATGLPTAEQAPASQSRPEIPTTPTDTYRAQPEQTPPPMEGDDPLPPGAVIPDFSEPKPKPQPDAQMDAGQSASRPGKLQLPWTAKQEAKPASGPREKRSIFRASGPERKPEPLVQNIDEPGYRQQAVPWEQPSGRGLLKSFYHTVLQVLFRPQEFFPLLQREAPLLRPTVFFIILSVLFSVVNNLWVLLFLSKMQSQALVEAQPLAEIAQQNFNLATTFLIIPFQALFSLFFQSGLCYLMFRLTEPERANFNTLVRVLAYSSASFVLYVIPFLGYLVGTMWFIISIFLGCKYALNITWGRTFLTLLPLFILEAAIFGKIVTYGLAGG